MVTVGPLADHPDDGDVVVNDVDGYGEAGPMPRGAAGRPCTKRGLRVRLQSGRLQVAWPIIDTGAPDNLAPIGENHD